jgi:hypothetical protein
LHPAVTAPAIVDHGNTEAETAVAVLTAQAKLQVVHQLIRADPGSVRSLPAAPYQRIGEPKNWSRGALARP